MKFKKYISLYDDKKFIIEEDLPKVGAYLYMYDGENCIYDYLQDSVQVCKEIALEEFNVPLDSWELFEK